MNKLRLDTRLAALYPRYSKTQLQAWIKEGKVTVDGTIVTKPGMLITEHALLVVDVSEPKYVSRAGLKLEKALDHFKLDVKNIVALDAGLSTGGFTDCLLQHGVARVYGVDVGHSQVHEKIKNDPRVVVMEKTNLRTLDKLPEKTDLVTLDLSFISVLKVMDAVTNLLKLQGKLIVLIKPQFEAGPEHIGKGGIIKDEKIHTLVVEQVVVAIQEHGFVHHGTVESPILGSDGNKEFLAYFQRN